MTWRSITGTTCDVRGWDPVKTEPITVRSGIVATGDTTVSFTPAVGAGIFYAALTAEPTE